MSTEPSPSRTVDERARRAREARERHAALVREKVMAILQAQLPADAQAWLIGSLAWGGFGERSDVDIVVSSVPHDQLLKIERAIGVAADAVVDVLELETLPAAFRERVVAEGISAHGR